MARSTRGKGATRTPAKPDPHAKTDCHECAKKTPSMNVGGWCDRCGLMAGHMKSCLRHREHKPKGAAAATLAKSTSCVQCGAAKGKPHKSDCPNAACSECKSILGHLLTCSHHPNYRPVLDGKTGAVLEATVDGKDAKIDTTPKPKKTRAKKSAAPDVDDDGDDDDAEAERKSGLTRLAPPKITDLALLEALQYGLDKKIIFGIRQPLTKSKPCDIEWFDEESNQSVGCAASAVFDFEKLDTCIECKHTSKRVLKSECIAHMALDIAGELKDRQISLFEVSGGADA